MKILLIGAGQLGSRHLQGILKSAHKTEVFVLDPSTESLIIAKQRAEEITDFKAVNYVSSWNNLPNQFDLAIISTNADIREAVTIQLLENHQVRFLILEKVLFQEATAYERIATLIEKHAVATWVNHPRRMFTEYQHIKDEYQHLGETCTVNITGGNWGLGCNGLHFLDLILFITGQELGELDAQWIDNEIQESKRANYVEFTGTLKGTTGDGSTFTITSFPNEPAPVTITICTTSARWIIQEGGLSKTMRLSKANDFQIETGSFEMMYQSSLTTTLVDQIFSTADCELPTYSEAANLHQRFVVTLLEKYNTITGKNASQCPIT
jgi:predicted dehydrogenase